MIGVNFSALTVSFYTEQTNGGKINSGVNLLRFCQQEWLMSFLKGKKKRIKWKIRRNLIVIEKNRGKVWFLFSLQFWRSLRVEQSGDLHPQRPQSAAIPGALRRGHHPQPEEQRLHLPHHLRQGEATYFLFGWASLAFVLGLAWSVFVLLKSRYWGSDANKNEVQGTVLDQSGNIIHSFGGLWHEGIFCDTLPTPKCVWKPSESVTNTLYCQTAAGAWLFCQTTDPQPKDYLLYYGFSTFAMELNELTPDLKPLLPPTDTRLRPDQR